MTRKSGWLSRHSWVTWVFSGVGVAAVVAIIAALSPKNRQPIIEQRTQGPNSPNVVGNSNVINYAVEPNERGLPPRFGEALAAFDGQRFWVIGQTNDWDETSEQIRFARALDAALQAARWEKTPNVSAKVSGRLYMRVSDRGVIVYASQSALPAGAALRDELRRGLNKAELASTRT